MKKTNSPKSQSRQFFFFPREEELLKGSLLQYSCSKLPITVPKKWIRNNFISFFYKTPKNIVCPHFWVFKPIIGCPYQCTYCFLQGTFFGNKAPRLKDLEKTAKQLEMFLSWATSIGLKVLLNVGELCDSLAIPEWTAKVLKTVVPILDKYPGNKLLFLTKAGFNNINFLLKNASFNRFVIVSFSLNPKNIIEHFEIGTAPLEARLKAAERLQEKGYEIRLRIDPIIPVKKWPVHYSELIKAIFEEFHIKPERITIGSLRGLKKTILFAKNKDWVKYLDKKEKTGWGLKIRKDLRFSLYSKILRNLRKYEFSGQLALCKETPDIWRMLATEGLLLDPGKPGVWENVKCNCKS